MGRRRRQLSLSSLLFKSGDTTSSSPSSSSWGWPSCNQQPRTNSFRGIVMNSVYDSTTTEHSFVRSDNDSESFSTASEKDDSENLIRGLTGSDRLFFEPGGGTRSILASKGGGMIPFKESVAMALDTEDPYLDFKKSMEEMVAAHGIKEWECLEELLAWYLRVNGKKTHGYIVGAFVDLLVGLNAKVNEKALPCSSSSYSSSSLSLSSRNCHEIEEVEGSGSC